MFILFVSAMILSSCLNSEEKIKFQESDKIKLVLQENVLSEQYLNKVEFKNHIYEKAVDSILLDTSYEYESELWKNDKKIGIFLSSTYIHPKSDSEDMEELFLSYILGLNYTELSSDDVRFKRNYDYKIPYKTSRIYKLYKLDSINSGLDFNILKENKTIHFSIITNDEFEFELKSLIKKLNEI